MTTRAMASPANAICETGLYFAETVKMLPKNQEQLMFFLKEDSGIAVIYGENYYDIIVSNELWCMDFFAINMATTIFDGIKKIHFQGHAAEAIDLPKFILRHIKRRNKREVLEKSQKLLHLVQPHAR